MFHAAIFVERQRCGHATLNKPRFNVKLLQLVITMLNQHYFSPIIASVSYCMSKITINQLGS